MSASHLILILLWIIYCVLHSLLASIRFKNLMHLKLGNSFRFYRTAYNVFAFLSIVAIILYQLNLSTYKMFEVPGLVKILALLLLLCGSVIMIVMIKKYFMSLSGLRSIFETPRKEDLMTDGLHQFVRHPLYLGTFLMLWGWFLTMPLFSLFLSNLIITMYTLIGIRLEEKKLAEEFGEEYEAYRNSTPMIIPHLGFKRKVQP